MHGPSGTAFAYAALSLVVALGWAVLSLARDVAAPRAIVALRRLHSGRPRDYVTWTVLGVLVLWVLLAVTVGGPSGTAGG